MIHDTTPLIAALDGGGSTCRARVETPAGEVLGVATGGASNLATNAAGARAVIAATLGAAYRAAGLTPARAGRDVACFSLAGTEAGIDLAALNVAPGFARLAVISDLDATVDAALGGADGVLASLGTGSFFVVQRQDARRRVGGWGFHLSDECSGAALGRSALRRAVAAFDGLAATSALTDAVLGDFADMRAMIAFAQAATPEDYARYARQLVTALEAGDPVAGELFERAAARLAAILDGLGAREIGRVCLTGGLGPVYRRFLSPELKALCTDPLGTPLDGAAARARAMLEGRA